MIEIINIEDANIYLINKNMIKDIFKKYIFIKKNKVINVELTFDNIYENVKLVDPKYCEPFFKSEIIDFNNKSITNSNKELKEVYLIDLGINYISYYNDKIVNLFYS